MFDIDSRELTQFEKNLNEVHKYAFVDTVRATLTKEAYETSVLFKKNVASEFTIRGGKSNIVLKSIHYEKAQYSEKDINKLEAHAGQQGEFYGKKTEQLRKQEFGETIVSKTKHIAKPTKFARKGSYKKLVDKEKLLAKIKVKRIGDLVEHPAKSEFKEFRQAIGYIHHNPEKTIHFLPSSESYFGINGIVELKENGDKSANFVYSLKDKTQPLKKRPALKPAFEQVAKKGGEIFKEEAQRRIDKAISKGLKK